MPKHDQVTTFVHCGLATSSFIVRKTSSAHAHGEIQYAQGIGRVATVLQVPIRTSDVS